ncbi:MAG: hypothetical protein V8S87_01690 [Oscillospiraceae bacterium]
MEIHAAGRRGAELLGGVLALIGSALSALFNDGKVDPVVIARAGQEAENRISASPAAL